jgi:hypothetical protein
MMVFIVAETAQASEMPETPKFPREINRRPYHPIIPKKGAERLLAGEKSLRYP